MTLCFAPERLHLSFVSMRGSAQLTLSRAVALHSGLFKLQDCNSCDREPHQLTAGPSFTMVFSNKVRLRTSLMRLHIMIVMVMAHVDHKFYFSKTTRSLPCGESVRGGAEGRLQSGTSPSLPSSRLSHSAMYSTASNRNKGKRSQWSHHKMKPHQIVSRVARFWLKAGPIIAHYQWTRAWFSLRNDSTRQYRDIVFDQLHNRYAPRALELILEMKGLFIKLGQVMSSRPDFVPRQYTHCFGLLQDYVPPWDGEEIKDLVTQSLKEFQGLDFDQVFDSFDPIPLGSASIGQVHKANLHPDYYHNIRSDRHHPPYSGGSQVAVKVMHCDAKDRFHYDFKIFKWLCRVALPGWKRFLNELERQMMTEFDYRKEASNLRIARKNMMESPFKDKIVIPEPIESCSSPYVLVMEMLEGEKLADAAESQLTKVLDGDWALAKDIIRIKRQEIIFQGNVDVSHNSLYHSYRKIEKRLQKHSLKNRVKTLLRLVALARTQRSQLNLLLDAHGYQIFINGYFNGDPHPGNVLLLQDGRLGLIDYGQFKILSDDERKAAAKIIKEIGTSQIADIDKAAVKKAMFDVGFRFRYNKDDDAIRRIASLFFDSDAEKSEFGFPSPQEYLIYLQSKEPIVHIPDSVVFIARCSFLFRGMSALLGEPVRTAHRWERLAAEAILK